MLIIIATCLALMLNSEVMGKRTRNAFRTIFFSPVVLSLIVTAISFSMLFQKDIGFLNIAFRKLGLQPRDWLTDPKLVMPSLICIVTWRWAGYFAIIVLAGLQTIPVELYEAATVDGAGRLTTIRYITLPLLTPILVFCITISLIGALQLFDEPYLISGAQSPMESIRSVVMSIYFSGFTDFELGYASAMSYVWTLLIFCVAIVELRILGKRWGLMFTGK